MPYLGEVFPYFGAFDFVDVFPVAFAGFFAPALYVFYFGEFVYAFGFGAAFAFAYYVASAYGVVGAVGYLVARSEERRVGKECRL